MSVILCLSPATVIMKILKILEETPHSQLEYVLYIFNYVLSTAQSVVARALVFSIKLTRHNCLIANCDATMRVTHQSVMPNCYL